jgi:UrcA family protein
MTTTVMRNSDSNPQTRALIKEHERNDSGDDAMNTPRDSRTFARYAGRALAAVVLSAACLALPVAPAWAGGTDAMPASITVHYAPASLEQMGYAQDLHARLKDAATQVCGEKDIREGRNQSDVDHCVDRSLARAVRKIESPTLLAVHEGAAGRDIRLAASGEAGSR